MLPLSLKIVNSLLLVHDGTLTPSPFYFIRKCMSFIKQLKPENLIHKLDLKLE